MGPAKWPISGLLSAEYPMISVDLRVPAPPHVRATAGPRRATPPPQGIHATTPCVASVRARASIFSGVARRPASHVRYDSGDAPSVAANAACDWPSAIRHARSVRGSTTSHHAIGAGRCEAGVGLAVLQSANLWGRPVTFFACTFAPGAQAMGTIGEFSRKMARPAGFEPATPGLEDRCAVQVSYGRGDRSRSW